MAGRRGFGSSGSMQLSSALAIGLLVLVAAGTLFTFGEAIACLFAKEASWVDNTAFYSEVPEVTEGVGNATVKWAAGGTKPYVVLIGTPGDPGFVEDDPSTWAPSGEFDASPAAGLTINAGDRVAVSGSGGKCGYGLRSPWWPEGELPAGDPWYAAFNGYDGTAGTLNTMSAYDADGKLAWSQLPVVDDPATDGDGNPVPRTGDETRYRVSDAARSETEYFALLHDPADAAGTSTGLYSMPFERPADGPEPVPELRVGASVVDTYKATHAIATSRPSLSVSAEGTAALLLDTARKPLLVSLEGGSARQLWPDAVTSVRFGRDGNAWAVTEAGKHLVHLETSGTEEYASASDRALPANVMAAWAAASAADPDATLEVASVDSMGQAYVTVGGGTADFLVSADGLSATPVATAPNAAGLLASVDAVDPLGSPVGVADARSPMATLFVSQAPNTLYRRDGTGGVRRMALFASGTGQLARDRVGRLATPADATDLAVLPPSVIDTSTPASTVVAVGAGLSGSLGLSAYCIAVSNDAGLSWHGASKAGEVLSSAEAVAFNGSRWLVIGGTGINRVAYSDDNGKTWLPGGNGIGVTTWPAGIDLNWNGEYWLATTPANRFSIGGTAYCIATSPDGITWTGRLSAGAATHGSAPSSACWTGSRWVAIVPPHVHTGWTDVLVPSATLSSTDAVTWNMQSTGPYIGGEDSSIEWNGKLLLVGRSSGWMFMSSLAGTGPWTYGERAGTSSGTKFWNSATPAVVNGGGVASLAWNGREWLASGRWDKGGAATSADGYSWDANSTQPGDFYWLGGACWAEDGDGTGRWVVVGSSILSGGRPTISVSEDGKSWRTPAGAGSMSNSLLSNSGLDVASSVAPSVPPEPKVVEKWVLGTPSPVGQGSELPAQPVVAWDPVPRATGYHWTVGGVPQPDTASTSPVLSGLAAGNHTVRVQAYYTQQDPQDPGDYGRVGGWGQCTVTVTPHVAARIKLPTPVPIVMGLLLDESRPVAWAPILNATGYRYRYNGLPVPASDLGNVLSRVATAPEAAPAQNSVEVQAYDSTGVYDDSDWGRAVFSHDHVGTVVTAVPVIVAAGSHWPATANRPRITLGGFTTCYWSLTGPAYAAGSTAGLTMPGLGTLGLPGGTYLLTMGGVDAGGNRGTAATTTVTISRHVLPTPVPSAASPTSLPGAVVSWLAVTDPAVPPPASAAAVSYRWQVLDAAGATVATGTATSGPIAVGLRPGRNRVRVQATSAEDTDSAWGECTVLYAVPKPVPYTYSLTLGDGQVVWSQSFNADAGTEVRLNRNGPVQDGKWAFTRADATRFAVPNGGINSGSDTAKLDVQNTGGKGGNHDWYVDVLNFGATGLPGSWSTKSDLLVGQHVLPAVAQATINHSDGHVTSLRTPTGILTYLCLSVVNAEEWKSPEAGNASIRGRLYMMGARALLNPAGEDSPSRAMRVQPARISPGTVSPVASFAGGPARQMSDIAWEAAGVTYTENGVTKTIPNLLMVTGDSEGDRTASSRYEWVPTNRRMRVISAGTRQVLSDVPMNQRNNRIGVTISGGLVLPAK